MAISAFILTKTPTGNINEGTTITLQGNWSDSATPPSYAININWGDGQSSNFMVAVKSFNTTHKYTDNRYIQLAVGIYDGSNPSTYGYLTFTVINVTPTVTLAAACQNNTGDVALALSIADPGTDDTFIARVVWGDGFETNINYSTAGAYTLYHNYSGFPSGSQSHRRLITAVVTDDDGGAKTRTTYPAMSFEDSCDDSGDGIIEWNGIVQYDDVCDDSGDGVAYFNGIPVYQFESDDSGYGLITLFGSTDYTSVFILTSDVECRNIGTIPFEQLIPRS